MPAKIKSGGIIKCNPYNINPEIKEIKDNSLIKDDDSLSLMLLPKM